VSGADDAAQDVGDSAGSEAIADVDVLFRFIRPGDFQWEPESDQRIRSTLFSQTTPVSFNRETIWPLKKNLAECPTRDGLCSMTAARFRGLPREGRAPDVYETLPDDRKTVDVVPDPITPPRVDPHLGIPNPSHASATRKLTEGEQRHAARIASLTIHKYPERHAS
jgi:hypothetical protein